MTVKQDKSGSFKATNHLFEGLHQRISKIGSRSIGSAPPAWTHSWMSLTNTPLTLGNIWGIWWTLSIYIKLYIYIYISIFLIISLDTLILSLVYELNRYYTIFKYIYIYTIYKMHNILQIIKWIASADSWSFFPVLSMSCDMSLPRLIKKRLQRVLMDVSRRSHLTLEFWWLLIPIGTYENTPQTQIPTFLACTLSIL